MSAEVLEPEVYVMPTAVVGDDIVVYPYAQIGSAPHIGKIMAVYEQAVDLLYFSTSRGVTYKAGIRHITDPRLQEKEALRADGAWDFSPSHKARASWQKRVEARIGSLKGVKGDDEVDLEELRLRYTEKFGDAPDWRWRERKLREVLGE